MLHGMFKLHSQSAMQLFILFTYVNLPDFWTVMTSLTNFWWFLYFIQLCLTVTTKGLRNPWLWSNFLSFSVIFSVWSSPVMSFVTKLLNTSCSVFAYVTWAEFVNSQQRATAVKPLLFHTFENPYLLISHRFFKLPSWYVGKLVP